MIFLKRIIGFIIDLILFLIFCEIIFFLFKLTKVEQSTDLIFFCSYFSVFIIPILLFQNTLSGKILKLEIHRINKSSLRLSLLLKSCLYYCIYFKVGGSLFIVLENVLKDFTILTINSWTYFFICAVFFISNTIIFIISRGAYNLLDYLLKIRYKPNTISNPHATYKITFLISAVYIILTVVVYRFRLDRLVKTINSEVIDTFTSEYYPIDDLGNYLQEHFIISKISKTNNIVTLSDPTSLYLNNLLIKKDIIVVASDLCYNDNNIRKVFCHKLLYYSLINDLNNQNSPEQTQITLYYRNRKSFFIYFTGVYKYYYDNKNPNAGIYGGINRQDLINIYTSIQNDYVNKYYKELATKLKLPIDTVKKYIDERGNMHFPKHLISQIDTTANQFSVVVQPTIPDLNSKIIFFDNVIPTEYLNANTPTNELIVYNFFGINYMDTDEEDFFEIKQNYVLGMPRE